MAMQIHPRRATYAALVASALPAGVAVFGVLAVIRAYTDEILRATDDQRRELVVVPVAKRVLEAGSVITEQDIELTTIGAVYVPMDALTLPEHVVGRTVIDRILPRELLRDERLAP